MTRGHSRKTKFWKETKSDRGLNDRMQAWAAAKRSAKAAETRPKGME